MKKIFWLWLLVIAVAACGSAEATRVVRPTMRPITPGFRYPGEATYAADQTQEARDAWTEIQAETQMAEEEIRRIQEADQDPECIDLAQAVNTQAGDYLCVTGTIDEVVDWIAIDKYNRDGEMTTEYEPGGSQDFLVSSDGRNKILLVRASTAEGYPSGGCQALWGTFENDGGDWSLVFDSHSSCAEAQAVAPPPVVRTQTGCPAGCDYPPPGCQIKGNISITTGEKIYHLPGQKWYSDTNISPEYGEACSAPRLRPAPTASADPTSKPC